MAKRAARNRDAGVTATVDPFVMRVSDTGAVCGAPPPDEPVDARREELQDREAPPAAPQE
jgi:hypothetical protein